MREQIGRAFDITAADPEIRCISVRGAGSVFSVGGDLVGNAPRERAFEEAEFVRSADAFLRALRETPLRTAAVR